MQSPRTRTGRSTTAALGALLGCVLLAGGCGSGSGGPEAASADGEETSTEARDCRGEWADLGRQVDGRDRAPNPSALATRWTSIAATTDYYAVRATEEDCGSALAASRTAITDLEEFAERLAAYDMPRRLQLVYADATAYANGPSPSASPLPKGAGKKERKQAERRRPPAPATIGKDLATLTERAPVATEDQEPAWRQARVVDLADDAAVDKAVKDLAFLSSESAAYRACAAALGRIRTALAATD